jgi:ferric-dicitrate binding protein FerR (iron transport regulator)
MQTNNFQELLDKYLTGRLTEQERNRFYELLNDPEHNRQLAAIIDKELYEHTFESEPDNKLLAAIQQNLHSGIQAEKEKRAKVIRLTRRLAVASVLVIGICGVAWWWLTAKKPTPNEIVQEKPVNDKNAITPGGNKAILKLSDGREIVLDSVANGALAQQGNSQVTKTKSGELVYEVTAQNSGGPLTTHQSPLAYNTIATPRGGQYQLVLADGSKVWLNASSSLRYPTAFTGKERRVELTGEGYFEVAKNASMPFHVQVNQMDVEVLGTHFNINAYDDESAVKTTLLEGSVKVVKRETANVKENPIVLQPGQQAEMKPHSPLAINHSPNIEEVMAWKNGLFQFKAAGIETVLRQAARWYDVEFVYKGNIPEKFSGQISRSANAEQLLKILELTGKVKFEINGKTIIVKQ